MFNKITIGGGIKHLILMSIFALFVAGCANAGKDQRVNANTLVTLDASASTSSVRGKITKYTWKQIRGTKVQLSDNHVISPIFTAPNVSKITRLLFRLTTIETGGFKSKFKTRDIVKVIVNPKPIVENKVPIASAEANTTTIEIKGTK